MRKYNKNKLFYILLFAMLCATQEGCPEQQEWYINDDGCVAGKYRVYSQDDLDFVKTISCFTGGLFIMGELSKQLKPGVFDHITEINNFMSDITNPPEHFSENEGIISFPNVTKMNFLTIFGGGVHKVIVPKVAKIDNIWLESQDLVSAQFVNLETIAISLDLLGNSNLEVLDLPKLKNLGEDATSLNVLHMEGANTILDFNLPELENVHGDIILSGILNVDEGPCQIHLPKLATLGQYSLTLEALILSELEIPLLKEVNGLSIIGVSTEDNFSGLAVEKVGGLYLNNSQTSDGVATLPYLKQAGSITMRYSSETSRLYMPQLEQLGLLYLVDTKELREVDFPAIQCLGAINFFTDFISGPYCMVPEDFDAIIAQSQAGGCDTTLEMLDPRNSPYWDYEDFCEP